jgi:hypothetical protein
MPWFPDFAGAADGLLAAARIYDDIEPPYSGRTGFR